MFLFLVGDKDSDDLGKNQYCTLLKVLHLYLFIKNSVCIEVFDSDMILPLHALANAIFRALPKFDMLES